MAIILLRRSVMDSMLLLIKALHMESETGQLHFDLPAADAGQICQRVIKLLVGDLEDSHTKWTEIKDVARDMRFVDFPYVFATCKHLQT